MKMRMLVAQSGASPVWVSVHAPSLADGRRRLEMSGVAVLVAQPSLRGRWSAHIGRWTARLGRRNQPLNLMVFCTQLAVLLTAGLGIVESLRALATNAPDSRQRQILDGILAPLNTGQSFSHSLLAQPEHFPALFVAMMRSAERTSSLAQTLDRYIVYARTVNEIKAKVRAAAVYPAFLAGLGGLVVLFLMIYVVPRFAGVYESVRAQLPWAAVLMMLWGQFVKAHAGLLAAGTLSFLAAVVLAVRHAPLRAWVARMVAKAPGMGPLLTRIHLARLYRTLAMLLAGGIPLLQALGSSRPLLPTHLQTALQNAEQQVSQGRSACDALTSAGLATPITANLLQVGDRSGDLRAMLDESARFLELEIAQALDRTLRIFEPALMTVIGLIIGFIVILMYLPIFELAGSLS